MLYEPDYTVVVDASRNRLTPYLPLYEHNVCYGFFDAATGEANAPLLDGDKRDKKEFFRRYTGFLQSHGYDVTPFEGCVVELIQNGEGLMGQAESLFKTTEDIELFPWDSMPDRYFAKFGELFDALGEELPPGMKAAGGVGNGVFETVQDFIPFTELAYLMVDEPEAFELVFDKVGSMLLSIWGRFLDTYGDMYAVCRFGDDLGFKTATLLQPDIIRHTIIPQYRKIISLVHAKGKPFLLHSCGNIFTVMDDIIEAGIDAKHSNEDSIAPFTVWVGRYGNRIGNFGGIDMNVLCLEDDRTIKEYVRDVLRYCDGRPGIAIGSGNQIADYVPPQGFESMVEAVFEYRKKKNS